MFRLVVLIVALLSIGSAAGLAPVAGAHASSPGMDAAMADCAMMAGGKTAGDMHDAEPGDPGDPHRDAAICAWLCASGAVLPGAGPAGTPRQAPASLAAGFPDRILVGRIPPPQDRPPKARLL